MEYDDRCDSVDLREYMDLSSDSEDEDTFTESALMDNKSGRIYLRFYAEIDFFHTRTSLFLLLYVIHACSQYKRVQSPSYHATPTLVSVNYQTDLSIVTVD